MNSQAPSHLPRVVQEAVFPVGTSGLGLIHSFEVVPASAKQLRRRGRD